MTNSWKDIEGYEGLYKVSSKGKVMSTSRIKPIILKTNPQNGYDLVYLTKRYVRNSQYLHRVVAKAFIPNPENKPQVNHKDGNKRNNKASNLEWMTISENITHAYQVLGVKPPGKGRIGKLNNLSRPVIQKDKNGTFIKYWDCQKDVERATGMRACGVSQVCTGYLKTFKGFKWEYACG